MLTDVEKSVIANCHGTIEGIEKDKIISGLMNKFCVSRTRL
jgi:hypothetical protein